LFLIVVFPHNLMFDMINVHTRTIRRYITQNPAPVLWLEAGFEQAITRCLEIHHTGCTSGQFVLQVIQRKVAENRAVQQEPKPAPIFIA
jgi:hypothetical protein